MAQLAAVDIDKAIGKRMQMRRKELGYTADQLSELIGISQQQMSRYERGANKINVSHLVHIATYLKTPISWFFLDCEEEIAKNEKKRITNSLPIDSNELKDRLNQHWEYLSNNQRKKLISFLDALSPIK